MLAVKADLTALGTAILLGCAAVAPAHSSQAYGNLSGPFEGVGSALAFSSDYWSASRLYLQQAETRDRMNQTPAACAALSQSLAYYRMALAEQTGVPTSEAPSEAAGEDEGIQDIRSRFGCTRAQFAERP